MLPPEGNQRPFLQQAITVSEVTDFPDPPFITDPQAHGLALAYLQ